MNELGSGETRTAGDLPANPESTGGRFAFSPAKPRAKEEHDGTTPSEKAREPGLCGERQQGGSTEPDAPRGDSSCVPGGDPGNGQCLTAVPNRESGAKKRTRGRRCARRGCHLDATFGTSGWRTRTHCRQHAEDGMVDVTKKACSKEGCSRQASHGVGCSGAKVYCTRHALNGMVGMGMLCNHEDCTTRASFGPRGTRGATYCKQHAAEGMVNVARKPCGRKGCLRYPTFNKEGSRGGVYCRNHAEEGMVNVANKRCRFDGCRTQPAFGYDHDKIRRYCRKHALQGTVDVASKRCQFEGCRKQPMCDRIEKKPLAFCREHSGDGSFDAVTPRTSPPANGKRATSGPDGRSPRKPPRLSASINTSISIAASMYHNSTVRGWLGTTWQFKRRTEGEAPNASSEHRDDEDQAGGAVGHGAKRSRPLAMETPVGGGHRGVAVDRAREAAAGMPSVADDRGGIVSQDGVKVETVVSI